jgi:ribosome-binding ATPase YchF (GTP1/OBG family)
VGVNVWYLDLQLPMQSVPITTDAVGLTPAHSGRGLQHYVIKFVSDLRQVDGFLWVIRFPPSIELTAMIYLKYY